MGFHPVACFFWFLLGAIPGLIGLTFASAMRAFVRQAAAEHATYWRKGVTEPGAESELLATALHHRGVRGLVTTGGVRAGFGSASTLTLEDVRAIRREDPAVAEVGYVIRQQGHGDRAG